MSPPLGFGRLRSTAAPLATHASVIETLRQALPTLSIADRAELASLAHETDPGLFWSALNHLGRRLLRKEQIEAAAAVYSLVMASASDEENRAKAQREVEAIEGKGAIGGRAEFLLSRFAKDASDPCTILPMMAGSAFFQAAKGVALGRMAASTNPAWWMRGMAGRMTASSLAYGVEVPVFALSGRAMRSLGSESVVQASLGQELGSAAITLGALKLSGAGSQSLMGKMLNKQPAPITRFAVSQGAMFWGLWSAHAIEAGLGLRPTVDGATTFTDILSSMVSLGIGASLGNKFLGNGYAARNRELSLRIQKGGEGLNLPSWAFSKSLAVAEGPVPLELYSRTERAFPSQPLPVENSRSLEVFQKQYDRIYRSLEKVFARLEEGHAQAYLEELDGIAGRRDFWAEQSRSLEKLQGEERDRFAQDIDLGLRLLGERLLRVGSSILQEPLTLEMKPRWGLRFRPEKRATERPERTEPKPLVDAIPALINRDVGYGKGLALREHQVSALHAIRGRIKLLQSMIEEGGEILPEALAGTVVMPVGGGKTRTMVAGFASTLELGFMDPSQGDKLIILNHTDQIHEQNRKVAELLGPFFKKKVGRELKISEYKAEKRDLSGDVIVVSIPSLQGEGKLGMFQTTMAETLGQRGKVAMVAVDEVHHLGLSQGKTKETWAQALDMLREVSPNLLEVGFTATPTGKEPGRLFTVRERELMHARVTPRTYLIKVEGIDLSQLKVTTSGEFEQRAIQSTLLNNPERNRRLYGALTEHGLRSEQKSPSGQTKLEATLGFGQDLSHAAQMANDYVDYYAKGQGELSHRKLLFLGQNRGKIAQGELEQALRAYRQGEIDGIVALVSGETKGQRNPILQAVTQGEIEAVFTVDALVEGADLYMFTHQLGARPTFSRIKKGQERGRINRRGPDEVSREGRLLKDPPKILFDVVDRYSGESPLIRYGDILGVQGHANLKSGVILDALSGKPTSAIDRRGASAALFEEGSTLPPKQPRPKRSASDTPWGPLAELLSNLLAEKYGGDLESLSLDLGETEAFVEGLLEGRGWENNRWFMKRLATLLYQDRESFLTPYNELRGQHDASIALADYEILQGALGLYGLWEKVDPYLEGFRLGQTSGPTGDGVAFSPNTLRRITNRTLSDGVWRDLWRGLFLYFKNQTDRTDFETSGLAAKQSDHLLKHFFERRGWSLAASNPREALLLVARRGVVEKYAGVLPENPGFGLPIQGAESSLTRWLQGKHGKGWFFQSLYDQVRKLLSGLEMEDSQVEKMLESAIFTEQGWKAEASNPREALLLAARHLVAREFGGVLPSDPGMGLPNQNSTSSLTRWLQGEEIKYSGGLSPHAFYDQVRKLLSGLGVEEAQVREMVGPAIFTEQGWKEGASNPREALLLAARRGVAREFGGVLPVNPGMGLPTQSAKAPLTRWLQGEELEFSGPLSPQAFYDQVRKLLSGLGMEEAQVRETVEAAIFTEQGWKEGASDPREALLLAARRAVAREFGGVLPTNPGMGLPTQNASAALTRWLQGKEHGKVGFSTQAFYDQIRKLLSGLGVEEAQVREMVEAAIFTERGWKDEASNPREALLLVARSEVAREFGGVLPTNPGMGLPIQKPQAALNRWLQGEEIRYSRSLSPQAFYDQVRKLLSGLGVEVAKVREMVEAAIFTEQGWKAAASNPRETLLLAARRGVAREFGGILPTELGWGLPRQNAQASLTRWIQGEELEHVRGFKSQAFYDQVRKLLSGLGMEDSQAREMIEAAAPNE